ncbi:MAG: bifunctional ornithine acetyltransferase/N-acetylglutamate synthase [Gemmatimonadetes bacterium]|nr:bifunctional ornithine acetyltransferase/N-acetylglutamate synthase [Gemmatimonadota bacterium]
MQSLNKLPDGSVTSPRAFSAGAASAGLKPDDSPDIAVLLSDTPCSGAGVFTGSRVRAAPVLYDEALLAERPGRLRGIVMNSHIANACTGTAGLEDAASMAEQAEAALDLPARSVLVLSTGAIGVPLPMDRIAAGVQEAAGNIHPEGGPDVARAIMTTDRTAKHLAIEVQTKAGTVTLGGVAKGSGMVHPNMATVLGIITTDAAVEAAQLGVLLRTVADRTFNAITVDGGTSPNDSVILLANGASEIPIARDAQGWKLFEEAVEVIARDLALMIVKDGGGAGRFVELTISGAATEAMARSIGRSIGSSVLVKTALGGGDHGWAASWPRRGAPASPSTPTA